MRLAPLVVGVDTATRLAQVLKMGPRRGDGAETAIVKLVAVKATEEAAN